MATNKKNKKKKKNIYKKYGIVFGCLLVLAVVLAGVSLATWKPVKEQVTIEVGERLDISDFLKNPSDGESFKTDISKVDTSALGEHIIEVRVAFATFKTKLNIVDTVAPTGEPVEITVEAGTIPKASECVSNIVDKTEVSVSFKENPDTSEDGVVYATVLLVDKAGNKSEVKTKINVWSDKEAPVISGVSNKTVTKGGTVSYRQGVTVTDNLDENPTLEIDNSTVDLNKVGKYTVTYTATDKSGNITTKTITVSVVEKESSSTPEVTEESVRSMALKVLNNITNDSMSQMEVAFAIYKWANTNIAYTGSSDKSNWVVGAYQAFTKKSGDCYNYFAAAKALFEVAGIQNVDVVKSVTTHSRHYWSLINLGDGWYHVDTTPRKGDGDLFFMVTDAELEAYSVKHSDSHIFDPSKYPERATKSIQDKIDYSKGKIKN